MTTIDGSNEDISDIKKKIVKLEEENDSYKKELITLRNEQKNTRLDEDNEKKIVERIQTVDRRITDNNQLILVKENQILEDKKQVTLKQQIRLEIIKKQGKITAAPNSYKFRQIIFPFLLPP